ncbi:MAG: hypothetical protein ABIA04_06095 [Pseudomonadota bacterium]
MKLPDFSLCSKFNKLRQEMKAEYKFWDIKAKWNYASAKDIYEKLQSVDGIEVEDILSLVTDDETFEYHGHKVLVYIRDWPVDKKYYDERGISKPRKYHLNFCRTLNEMNKRGRFYRYVASRRTSGKFKVNIIDRDSKKVIEIDNNKHLDVCRYCLDKFNFNDFDIVRKTKKENDQIFKAFKLEDFFKKYKNVNFISSPNYSENTAPLDVYPENFREISKKYRESKSWICEKCNIELKNHPNFLHVHHLASKADNSFDKLRALCIQCHSEMPMHETLKHLPEYSEFIKLRLNSK